MGKLSKETYCVHHLGEVQNNTKGLNTPIEPSSAFKYDIEEQNIYPRYFNTINQQVICDKIAHLENAEKAIAFSSGMAAISTVLFNYLGKGDHGIFYSELYGGTLNLIKSEFEKRDISYTLVNEKTEDAFKKAIQDNTKIIYFETPTNPLLSIVDMDNVANAAKKNGIVSIIDNTFASPINQNPVDFDIDLVIHSGTKYLGGHSDLSFGIVAGKASLVDDIQSTAINLGGNLNALDCYLIERSLKTLDVRVRRQSENAFKLAKYLQENPMVLEVFYPGLSNHPMHDIAKKQMLGFGAMLAFKLDVQEKAKVDDLLNNLRLITKALSLGGVESTICVPAETSHIKLTKEEREEMGITDNIVRLSVGIEKLEDLKEDFEQAFNKIK